MSAHRRKTVTLTETNIEGSTKHGVNYLEVAMGDPAELVYNAMNKLKDVQFDTMVGRGLSGALVVPLLARAMNKWFAIARKPDDGSHSCHALEGRLGQKWLFVDDVMCTGDTFVKTIEVVMNTKSEMQCVGRYMYGTTKDVYNPATFDAQVDFYIERARAALALVPLPA